VDDEPAAASQAFPLVANPTIVTVHGESATLWHVVDAAAPTDEQPAVVRTFSSVGMVREQVQEFIERSRHRRVSSFRSHG